MQLTIFNATCVGNAKNCTYPQKQVVTSAEELIDAVKYDHVYKWYNKNVQKIQNKNVQRLYCYHGGRQYDFEKQYYHRYKN